MASMNREKNKSPLRFISSSLGDRHWYRPTGAVLFVLVLLLVVGLLAAAVAVYCLVMGIDLRP